MRFGCDNQTISSTNFCSDSCQRLYITAQNEKLRKITLGISLTIDVVKGLGNKCENPGCQNVSKKKYCSQKCFHEHRVLQKLRYCSRTGCENTMSNKRRTTRFCSMECYLVDIRKNMKACKKDGCNTMIYGDRVFCSKQCYVEYRNVGVVKNLICQNCSQSLNKTQIRNGKKFCSHKCYSTNNLIQVGDMFINKYNNHMRRFIKTESGKILLSKHVWEQQNGKVPAGYKIDFKDGNPFNDQDVANLLVVQNYKSPIKSVEQVEIF